MLILSAAGVTGSALGQVTGTDASGNPIDQTTMTVAFSVLAILYAIAVVIFIIQLVAAIKFSKCGSAVALFGNFVTLAFWIYCDWAVYLSGGDPSLVVYFWIRLVIEVIAFLIWVYPLVGFIHEMNKGIMSKETYPREAYSCCCAPSV